MHILIYVYVLLIKHPEGITGLLLCACMYSLLHIIVFVIYIFFNVIYSIATCRFLHEVDQKDNLCKLEDVILPDAMGLTMGDFEVMFTK